MIANEVNMGTGMLLVARWIFIRDLEYSSVWYPTTFISQQQQSFDTDFLIFKFTTFQSILVIVKLQACYSFCINSFSLIVVLLRVTYCWCWYSWILHLHLLLLFHYPWVLSFWISSYFNVLNRKITFFLSLMESGLFV